MPRTAPTRRVGECVVPGCPRPRGRRIATGLCSTHDTNYLRYRHLSVEQFCALPHVVPLPDFGFCQVPCCDRRCDSSVSLCPAHRKSVAAGVGTGSAGGPAGVDAHGAAGRDGLSGRVGGSAAAGARGGVAGSAVQVPQRFPDRTKLAAGRRAGSAGSARRVAVRAAGAYGACLRGTVVDPAALRHRGGEFTGTGTAAGRLEPARVRSRRRVAVHRDPAVMVAGNRQTVGRRRVAPAPGARGCRVSCRTASTRSCNCRTACTRNAATTGMTRPGWGRRTWRISSIGSPTWRAPAR